MQRCEHLSTADVVQSYHDWNSSQHQFCYIFNSTADQNNGISFAELLTTYAEHYKVKKTRHGVQKRVSNIVLYNRDIWNASAIAETHQ